MNDETKQANLVSRLDELWGDVVSLQNHYLKYWGGHFQGLASHAEAPDGETKTPIDTSKSPSDQDATYLDFWRGKHWVENGDNGRQVAYLHPVESADEMLDLACEVQFHTSNAPSGHGWSLRLSYVCPTTGDRWDYARQHDGSSREWSVRSDFDDVSLDGL